MARPPEQVRLADVGARGVGALPDGRAVALPADDAVGQALTGFAGRLDIAGDRASRLIERAAIENAETAAKEADTKFNATMRGSLFDPERGFFTLQGEAAMRAYKDTEAALRKLQQEHAGAITNPEARRLFQDISTRRLDAAFDSMARHTAVERRRWIDTTSAARAADAGNDAIAYADDDAKALAALNVGRNEIITNGQDNGEDPAVTQRKLRDFETKALSGIVQRRALNDPMGAQRFYEANRHRIDGQQQIGLERMLKESTARRQAVADVDGVMAGAGAVTSERVHGAIIGHESGGRHTDAKGAILQSGKGARGVGQIMPETFKRFAKPGEKIDNEADNLAVSRRMIDKFMRDYGGDWQRAAVAYFSGEGNVAPMAHAKPYRTNSSDGGNTVEQYLANVRRNLQKAGAKVDGDGGREVRTHRDLREELRELDENFASYAEKMKAIDDPERRDRAMAELNRRQAIMREGVEAQARVYQSRAWEIVLSPGTTGKRPTSVGEIPPDLWSNLDAKTQESLRRQLEANGKGVDVKTDQGVWYEIQRGLSSEDPAERAAWASKSLLDYKDRLSDADFQELAKLQAAAKKGDPEQRLSAVRTLNQMVDDALRTMNMDPSPKPSTRQGSDAVRGARFRRAVQEQISALEAEKGKRATPEEVQRIVDAMTIKVGTGGWFSADKRRFELTIDDVPKAEREKITEALARAKRPVTDETIIELFARKNARAEK